MNYAIIAAGEGSRLAQEGVNEPKPLVKVQNEHLIDRLIRVFMDNDAEKYKLIENLTKYDLIDSKYTKILANTITNANYQIRLIKLFISYEKLELIEQIFYLIKNDQYVYDSLIEVHQFDKKLFDKLYNNGDCFRNQRYRIKMKEFLEKNEGHKLEIH